MRWEINVMHVGTRHPCLHAATISTRPLACSLREMRASRTYLQWKYLKIRYMSVFPCFVYRVKLADEEFFMLRVNPMPHSEQTLHPSLIFVEKLLTRPAGGCGVRRWLPWRFAWLALLAVLQPPLQPRSWHFTINNKLTTQAGTKMLRGNHKLTIYEYDAR